ncbi:hypothetical protein ANN_04508 [Periplaneta americana]|uniref:Uncharacterized protein n=1 Tax=Periplaneta americana TaxID=6978 RepID=A0ABQ8T8U9_PERAM|nr:hypothetical protein ANN_04508 [Periplaneta americana]
MGSKKNRDDQENKRRQGEQVKMYTKSLLCIELRILRYILPVYCEPALMVSASDREIRVYICPKWGNTEGRRSLHDWRSVCRGQLKLIVKYEASVTLRRSSMYHITAYKDVWKIRPTHRRYVRFKFVEYGEALVYSSMFALQNEKKYPRPFQHASYRTHALVLLTAWTQYHLILLQDINLQPVATLSFVASIFSLADRCLFSLSVVPVSVFVRNRAYLLVFRTEPIRVINDAVSTTGLFSVHKIGDSGIVFGEMRSRMSYIYLIFALLLGKTSENPQPVCKLFWDAGRNSQNRDCPGKNGTVVRKLQKYNIKYNRNKNTFATQALTFRSVTVVSYFFLFLMSKLLGSNRIIRTSTEKGSTYRDDVDVDDDDDYDNNNNNNNNNNNT